MSKEELCAKYFKNSQEELKNKQYTKALYLLKYILDIFPQDNSVNYLYGDTCLKVRDYKNAIMYITKSKEKFENELFYNVSLAKSYEFVNVNKSEFLYKKVLTLSNNHIKSLEMIALFYQNIKKDFKLSEYYLLLGITKYGNNNNFSYNLGVLYQDNELYDKAIECYNVAKKNKNFLHSIYNNLGNCFLKKDKISLAVLMFKKSINNNSYLSSSYSNLATLYKSHKRYKSALEVYKQGEKSIQNNEILWNASLIKLLLSDFKSGFELYENRLSLPKFKNLLPSLSGKRWQRENIENKVLLISGEQGFGDIIFFARYIKYVLLLNPKKIIILAPKELKVLLAIDKKIEVVLTNNDNMKYDYYCYIMSLAYLFYENNNNIPNETPYLKHNKKIINIKIDDSKFNIFLVWSTNSDANDARKRTIDLSLFAKLKDIKNANFYSMLNSTINSFNINNISHHINDFNDTAIILKKMDLVISIDTAVAHLAGALNIPCFVILPFDSNWRWGLKSTKINYYPSIKLIREDKNNKFQDICKTINLSIQDIIKSNTNSNKQINNININDFINKRKYVENINTQALLDLHNNQYNSSLKLSMKSILAYKNPIAFMNIALVYLKINELQKALWHIKESIFLQECDESYFHLGVCFSKLKNIKESINAFKKSIELNSTSIQPKHNLAFIYSKNDMNLEAIKINLDILNINPANIKALESLAVLFDRELDNKNAKKYYDILENKNDISSLTTIHMASFYFRDKQLSKAKKFLKGLIKNKLHLEQSHQLIGSIYKQTLQIDKAIFHYTQSMALNKTDKTLIWNLGFLHLSKGDYLKGFTLIEKRYETNLLSKKEFLKADKYNNENLNNRTLFIYMEQGFGDNILLIRYIKIIKNKYPNSTIYLSSRNELCVLFKGIQEIDEIFNTEDIKKYYDYHLSLFSMPFIFKTTIDTIPNQFPYIFPKKNDYKLHLDTNFINIGIIWRSGDKSTNQEERSISLKNFQSLSKNKKIKLFSLQKEDNLKEIEQTSINLINLSPHMNDFNDTANLILKLDLIISIDTAVAHLAGALNAKCFVILPEDTNWRWGLSGNKSPWFKSLKLFRIGNKTIKDLFIDIEKESLLA